jgi:hypothetical protein
VHAKATRLITSKVPGMYILALPNDSSSQVKKV